MGPQKKQDEKAAAIASTTNPSLVDISDEKLLLVVPSARSPILLPTSLNITIKSSSVADSRVHEKGGNNEDEKKPQKPALSKMQQIYSALTNRKNWRDL